MPTKPTYKQIKLAFLKNLLAKLETPQSIDAAVVEMGVLRKKRIGEEEEEENVGVSEAKAAGVFDEGAVFHKGNRSDYVTFTSNNGSEKADFRIWEKRIQGVVAPYGLREISLRDRIIFAGTTFSAQTKIMVEDCGDYYRSLLEMPTEDNVDPPAPKFLKILQQCQDESIQEVLAGMSHSQRLFLSDRLAITEEFRNSLLTQIKKLQSSIDLSNNRRTITVVSIFVGGLSALAMVVSVSMLWLQIVVPILTLFITAALMTSLVSSNRSSQTKRILLILGTLLLAAIATGVLLLALGIMPIPVLTALATKITLPVIISVIIVMIGVVYKAYKGYATLSERMVSEKRAEVEIELPARPIGHKQSPPLVLGTQPSEEKQAHLGLNDQEILTRLHASGDQHRSDISSDDPEETAISRQDKIDAKSASNEDLSEQIPSPSGEDEDHEGVASSATR